MSRTIGAAQLVALSGTQEPYYRLRIYVDDGQGIGAAAYSQVDIVSNARVLTDSQHWLRRDDVFTEGGQNVLFRVLYGLEGWSAYGAKLDRLGRKVTTQQVDFVLSYSAQVAEFIAAVYLKNKLCQLSSVYDFSGGSARVEFEEIAALWITDVRQDGARFIISARDGRELTRDLEADRPMADQLPNFPGRLVTTVYDDLLVTGSVSLPDTSANGHLMYQRNADEGGAAAMLKRSNIQSNLLIPSDYVQFDPAADFVTDRKTTQKEFVDEVLSLADASVYWPNESAVGRGISFDYNRAADFTLNADEFWGFEQLSLYEDVINRVLVDVPDPVNPGDLLSGYIVFEDAASAGDLATVSYPFTTLNATDYYKEHRIEARGIGHSFLFPILDAAGTIEKRVTAKSFITGTNWTKSHQQLGSAATTLTLQYPELCGFAGSSSRTSANKTLNGTTRSGWFAIGSMDLEGDSRQVDTSSGYNIPEIVEATALSFATPITTAPFYSGRSVDIPNPTVSIYGRPGTALSTIGSVQRFGRYTIARGARGTTAQDWLSAGEAGRWLYIWDLTGPALIADRIFAGHAHGVARVRFSVPRRIGVQMELGDFVELTAARFIRVGRPLGAGGGGTSDVFEINGLSNQKGYTEVEATWVRGAGTVTVSERASANRVPRPVGRMATSEVPNGLWNRLFSGSGQTIAAAGVAGETIDLTPYLLNEDQLITVDVGWLTFWNDDPGAGGDDRASIVRVQGEIFYDASGGTLTIRNQSSAVEFGLDPGHTYDLAISGLDLQVRVTQVGSGTNHYQWQGEIVGNLNP